MDFKGAGDTGECASELTPGQVVEFATFVTGTGSASGESSYATSTSTVSSSSTAWGIPVNGWIFPDSVARETGSRVGEQSQTQTTSSSTSTAAASSDTPGLSNTAKIGIAAGVPVVVIAIAAVALAIFFYKRANAKKQELAVAQAISGMGGNTPNDTYWPSQHPSQVGTPYSTATSPHYQLYQQQQQSPHDPSGGYYKPYEGPVEMPGGNNMAMELDGSSAATHELGVTSPTIDKHKYRPE